MGCCGLRVEGSRKCSHPALAGRVSACLPRLSGCRHTGPSLCTVTPTFCSNLMPNGRIEEQRNSAHSQHFLHPPAHHLCLGHIILPFQSSRPPLGPQHPLSGVYDLALYSAQKAELALLFQTLPNILLSFIHSSAPCKLD